MGECLQAEALQTVILVLKNSVLKFYLIDLVSTTTPEVERKEEEGVGEEDEGCCTSSVTPETLVHFSKGGLHFQFDEWCKSSWTPTARYHLN